MRALKWLGIAALLLFAVASNVAYVQWLRS